MATDWNALAKLGATAFKKDTAAVVPVRRKPAPLAPLPELPAPTLVRIPVMFADDVLCPEWLDLVAWARQAPMEAFEILPHRTPHKNYRDVRYISKAALQAAILAELDEAGYAVVVGLIYELRTLKAQWEKQACA